MTNWSVQASAVAERDLLNIYEYLAFALKEDIVAKKFAAKIQNQINNLSQFPFRFPIFSDQVCKGFDLRSMPVNNYRVFYTADDKNKTVNIIRIIYAKRDIKKHLNE